ncbi:MAG: type II toxin-antitoxin system YafQ family toxin [Oscillospiraceae bacterium]|nr:type II toxin-antitoxin system YafQ family toxin [Oscillospiraceae bacterium]
MMYKRDVQYSTQYRCDYKIAKKQGRDISLLREVTRLLANDEPLPQKHRDHALQGNWKGYRECNASPDWLLVYRKSDNGELLLTLARLASHRALDF